MLLVYLNDTKKKQLISVSVNCKASEFNKILRKKIKLCLRQACAKLEIRALFGFNKRNRSC